MRSLLKDLFMGKIDVMYSVHSKERNTVFRDGQLVKTLTPEQRELYEKVYNNLMDRCALEYENCFIAGFKMAFQLILECLSDTMEDEDSSDSL